MLSLPFVYSPGGIIPFEVPKVWWLWRWVEVITLLGIGGTVYRIKFNRLNNRLLALLVTWILVMVGASLGGSDWGKSVWGNYYRIDGLLTYFHLTGLAIIVGMWYQPNWLRLMQWAATLGIMGISIWYWVDPTHLSAFGQDNFLAGFLAVALPLALSYTWIVPVITILGTGSIGAIMVMGITGIVSIYRRSHQWGKWICVIGTLVLVGIITFYWQGQQGVAEGRERIFRRAIMGWQQRPILGWGVANVDKAIEANTWPMPVLHDIYVDKAHSTVLESLVTTGVMGLTAYIALISYLAWRLYHRHEYLWLTVLLLYFFHAQTNVISIAEEMYFWMALGVGLKD